MAGRSDAIKGFLPLSEDVRDVQWIHSGLVICATGDNGGLHLINVSTDGEMKIHGTLSAIHTAGVREMALNQANRMQFISGGYDRKLCLVDLERPDAIQSIKQDGIIGSVRWPLCNQNVCPSLTLDDGVFLIYDVRVRPVGPPAFKASMGKRDLFAHERYTDHNVLLGFGDGEVQHIDVRVTDRILHKFQDPNVEAIGAIEYGSEGAILLSGMSNFSLWKHVYTTGESRSWCCRSPKTSAVEAVNAILLPENNVFFTTSEGCIGLTYPAKFK